MPDTKTTKHEADARLSVYLAERRRLLRLAYRYLGSVSEAEDAVQDAWLRFSSAEEVEAPARYLSRMVTNLCLDRLKSAARRRETYVGPWLPEPIVEQAGFTDPEVGDAALDISYAVMRTLEKLSPLERAAMFLHDLYDVPYEEIGETLKRSPESCRQLVSRARKMLRKDGVRFQPSADDLERLLAGFETATKSGDIEPLKRLLASDVELVSDGGGKAVAALNVLHGFDRVWRFLAGVARKNPDPGRTAILPATVNDRPGLMVVINGRLEQIMSFAMNEAGQVASVYVVRNPDKLAGVAVPAHAAGF